MSPSFVNFHFEICPEILSDCALGFSRHTLAISTPHLLPAIMAPKHRLSAQLEETSAKRPTTPASRSATPAEIAARVPFSVQYPPADTKRKLSQKEQELVDHAEFQTSPFIAKGTSKKGELDQYYAVTPSAEWESMKGYSNFISEYTYVIMLCVADANNLLQSKVRYTRSITLYTCGAAYPERKRRKRQGLLGRPHSPSQSHQPTACICFSKFSAVLIHVARN